PVSLTAVATSTPLESCCTNLPVILALLSIATLRVAGRRSGLGGLTSSARRSTQRVYQGDRSGIGIAPGLQGAACFIPTDFRSTPIAGRHVRPARSLRIIFWRARDRS